MGQVLKQNLLATRCRGSNKHFQIQNRPGDDLTLLSDRDIYLRSNLSVFRLRHNTELHTDSLVVFSRRVLFLE